MEGLNELYCFNTNSIILTNALNKKNTESSLIGCFSPGKFYFEQR